jgi:hypothetical protein
MSLTTCTRFMMVSKMNYADIIDILYLQYIFGGFLVMNLTDITNQMYQAQVASWDKMFHNNLNQEEAEDAEVDDANVQAPELDTRGVTTGTAGQTAAAPTPISEAPSEALLPPGTAQGTGTAQAPQAPTGKDPLNPTDTPAAGGAVGANDGETIIECEETLNDIMSIMEKRPNTKGVTGVSNIMIQGLESELKKMGYDAKLVGGETYEVKNFNGKMVEVGGVGGKIELTAKNGTKMVIADSNGDGAIGTDDEAFAAAMNSLSQERTQSLAQKKSEQRAGKVQDQINDGSAKKIGGSNDDAAAEAGAATEAPKAEAPTEAPKAEAAPAAEQVAAPAETAAQPRLASVNDKVASIGSIISSGDDQVNDKGDKYKYQVKDTDLSSCPKGKKKCNGCGQCIKTEIYDAQKNQDTVEINQNGEEDVEAAETVAAEQQAAQKPGAPKPAVNDAQVKPELAAADEQEVAEVLKQIQAHLDSFGFMDKTAEDLLADGQLEQVALQLGIQLPEKIFS